MVKLVPLDIDDQIMISNLAFRYYVSEPKYLSVLNFLSC